MEGPISFWGYKEQESNLILPEHDDDDDDDDDTDKNIWHWQSNLLSKNTKYISNQDYKLGDTFRFTELSSGQFIKQSNGTIREWTETCRQV